MPPTTHFLPTREGDLLTFSANFSALITAVPITYGFTAAQATAYTALHTAYATAYASANSDNTRTPAVIVGKDAAKANLIAGIRGLAKIIQGCPTVTNQQRAALGLTVRSMPQPIGAPADSPALNIVSTVGNTVRIRLHDAQSPTSRAKPPGVSGASVFSFVGATAPTDTAGWKFEGNTSQTMLDVSFSGATAPGAKVWLTAFWFNPRKQSGPASPPVGTNIPGGSAMAA